MEGFVNYYKKIIMTKPEEVAGLLKKMGYDSNLAFRMKKIELLNKGMISEEYANKIIFCYFF